jgi:L,D-peptidoglycan transpeptidase YkuD (ErfK/YbiS/YcfS/YnhG family)
MKRTLALGLVAGLSVALLSPGNVAVATGDDITVVTQPDELCATTIPGIGPQTWAKMKRRSSQAIVVRGYSKRSDENNTELWQRTDGCWVKVGGWWGLNGFKGWHKTPWTGSLRTPKGVYGLTSTGGRKRNPGTTMPYHYGPKYWEKGGYKIHYPKQIYNFVIAMNYNRYNKKPPRVTRQPDPTMSSGYWFHTRGLGSTRGCVSMTKKQIRATLQWMEPSQKPQAIMGPERWLAR